MGDDGNYWEIAGVSPIKGDKDNGYTVRIPDKLFRQKQESILELGSTIHWSYEKDTTILIVSNFQPRDTDRFHYIDDVEFNNNNGSFDCTIPMECFPDFQGRGNPNFIPEWIQQIEIPTDTDLVFTYNDDTRKGELTSCYVLTENQFDKRFSQSNVYEELSTAPRFS